MTLFKLIKVPMFKPIEKMTNQEFVFHNYFSALEELTRINPNLPVLPTLRLGPNKSYNPPKLAYLLDKEGYVYKTPNPSAPVQTISAPLELEVIHNEKIENEELSQELKEIQNKRKDLFKTGSFLHANKLEDEKLTAQELRQTCFDILNIYDNLIPALDAEEKFIKENGGKKPEKIELEPVVSKVIDSTDKLEVYKRIQTLKKNIGRDKVKYPDRAAKYQNELDQLVEKYEKM